VLTSGLSVWRLAADEITLCRNALFTIPDRHPLVILVLRIERILQGDPEEASDPYLKEKGVSTDNTLSHERAMTLLPLASC
jgi:hypothetical protein